MPQSDKSGEHPSARGRVIAVCASPGHGFAKEPRDAIELLKELGVKDDAHCGATVRHLFDARRYPGRANLRQVHFIESELLAELNTQGFQLRGGSLGENITTSGIALDSLPRTARLHLGATAIVEVTGLRDPCVKMDRFQRGLRNAVTARRFGSKPFTRGGAMSVVVQSGLVCAGDPIQIELPEPPHRPLDLV
jgi:MOSC domain-containing protein YiiM